MKIYFYNQCNNGDLFYSREFIKDIQNKIGDSHYYIQKNDPSIFKDIDIELINIKSLDVIPDESLVLFKKDDDLYINTWIGQWMNRDRKFAPNLSTNYSLFTHIYNEIGIQIEPIDFYIPKVNFEKIDKINIDNFFNNLNKKPILVCNGDVYSVQSENFDFDPIINELSYIFQDMLFND